MSVRYPKDHSRKGCTCGGHSANDAKKSRHHHSTLVKMLRRQVRGALERGIVGGAR